MHMVPKLPVFLLTHGVGPCFFTTGSYRGFSLEGIDMNSQITSQMAKFSDFLPTRPKAILVISGHYYSDGGLRIVGDTDEVVHLLYDYGNFPKETYDIQWRARGSPELCGRIRSLLGEKVDSDNDRGFDHGVFIPLKLMFPEADIPTVLISIDSSWSSKRIFEVFSKLSPLKDEGVLIIGSGSLTHCTTSQSEENILKAQDFAKWVRKILAGQLPAEEKAQQLSRASDDAPFFATVHTDDLHWKPWVAASAACWAGVREPGVSKCLSSLWWHSLALETWALN